MHGRQSSETKRQIRSRFHHVSVHGPKKVVCFFLDGNACIPKGGIAEKSA
jgi:hypothetical protein